MSDPASPTDATAWIAQRFGLVGRTALVTGANRGIGRACAVALAGAGADVVLWGRDRDALAALAAEIGDSGGRAHAVPGPDLADRDAVRAAAERILAEHRIDILVNNAGMIRRGPAEQTALEDWDAVLAVNLDAVFLLSRLFGPPMLERGDGAIVTIASLLSFQGGILVPAYTASKHAVAGLTKALANEWAARGVRVNAVAPGYVETDNTAALRADEVRREAISARIPAGRWATPKDIAGAVLFLAGPAAGYVHGHTLVVDGGWLGR